MLPRRVIQLVWGLSALGVATGWTTMGARTCPRGTCLSVASAPSDEKLSDFAEKEREREAREYNLNVGSAIDTLRTDIPLAFLKEPDLSIFSEDIRVSDPQGEKLRGKKQITHMYRAIRGLSSVALQDSSTIQARFFFDKPQRTLRSKVSAKLRVHGMSMDAEPMHLDVVSTYTFDSKGLVVHHTVDRVDIDGTPTDALNLLKTDHGDLRGWLSGVRGPRGQIPVGSMVHVGVQKAIQKVPTPFTPPSVYRAEEQKFDIYGNIVPPSLQEKGPEAAKMVEKKKPGFLDFLKKFEPDYCEDDWECPSNQHCCDFVVAKTCCSGGIGVTPPELGLQYIPSRIDDGYQQPPDTGRVPENLW